MESFIPVANVRDIKPGCGGLIHLADYSIAIFNVGGAFYATDENCTGDGGSLSEGRLLGTTIMCYSDNSSYYLPTGECLNSTAKPVTTYAVHIDGGVIKINWNQVRRKFSPLRERRRLIDSAWFAEERI